MTDDCRSAEWRRLMDSVSFELDTDLRLHPQRLELGKAELLTDALRLPFVDIDKQLTRYIAGADTASAEALRRHAGHVLIGLTWGALILEFAPRYIGWLLPVIAGLIATRLPIRIAVPQVGGR